MGAVTLCKHWKRRGTAVTMWNKNSQRQGGRDTEPSIFPVGAQWKANKRGEINSRFTKGQHGSSHQGPEQFADPSAQVLLEAFCSHWKSYSTAFCYPDIPNLGDLMVHIPLILKERMQSKCFQMSRLKAVSEIRMEPQQWGSAKTQQDNFIMYVIVDLLYHHSPTKTWNRTYFFPFPNRPFRCSFLGAVCHCQLCHLEHERWI